MTNIETIKTTIMKELEQAATAERREMAAGNHPTAMKTLGVTVPDLKTVLKGHIKAVKKMEPKEVIRLATALVDTGVMECQHLAYQMMDATPKALKEMTTEDVLALGKYLDNWVSVDNYGCLIAGYAWREGIMADEVVEGWTQAEDFWMRRLAVVCTVALNQKARGGTGDPERTLKICGMLAQDKHDMVAKALSWAIRELAKLDETPTREFMEKYEAVLPKRVIREVNRKLTTGRKY